MTLISVRHISTSAHQGGAAIAMSRLHQALRLRGVDSSVLAQSIGYAPDLSAAMSFKPPLDPVARTRRVTRRVRFALERRLLGGKQPSAHFVTDPRSRYGDQVHTALRDGDIVNLHWATGFADVPSLLMKARQPLVLTLHDMNAFTGGCHYSLDCDRYLQSCGRCPYLGGRHRFDLSRRYWRLKQRAYRQADRERLVVVTPSQWLANEAGRSRLLGGQDIRVIPNGVDPEVFTARDRQQARQALGLPADAVIVLFVADGYGLPWKGTQDWAQILNALSGENWLLPLSIGRQPLPQIVHPNYRHLGNIAAEQMLAGVYGTVDAVIVPSRQDNFPNLLLEAMASARLVISTAAGGIPELVRHGDTGVVADFNNVGEVMDLLTGLRAGAPLLADIASRARAMVQKAFSLDRQAAAYTELYEELQRREGQHPS